MTANHDKLLEDLCAWMDGELPGQEARFLERRLAHDPALRAQWERWQLASACLRGQPQRLMPATLAPALAAALDASPSAVRGRSRWPWAAGVAAAVLAAVLLPRMLGTDLATPLPPSGGDLADRRAPILAPVPEAGVSPVDTGLALDDAPAAKPWPRSPLAPDDRAMEAYLVRHNAMMAGDGLGGFMPYVDVVTHEGVAADGDGER